jgi:hypothetical protein
VRLSVTPDPKRGWLVVRAIGSFDMDEVLKLLSTARSAVEHRMMPMLFDARETHGPLTNDDVERAVAVVHEAAERSGLRGHVAIAALDDEIFRAMLHYETRCAQIGVPVIRVFRLLADAEHWLEVMSAARHLG